MSKCDKFCIFLVATISFLTAFANDSAGTTAAGGITFTKTPQVSMEREELSISPTLIKVSYLFKNNSDNDITTQVFFPLPAYKPLGANINWDNEISAIKNPQDTPFLNFSVAAQGQPVQFHTAVRAMMNGQDITQQLQNAGIPLNPDLTAGNIIPAASGNNLPQWRSAAKQLGFLDTSGKPKWQKQITYYWTQVFPAHQLVLIQHQYKPAVGVFYAASESGKALNDLMIENLQRLQTVFNINFMNLSDVQALKNWLVQRFQQTPDASGIYSYFYNVDYILTTGANWGGPIKSFTLNIATPADGDVTYNHFYGNRTVTKTNNPGNISIFINNFIPQQNLQILYVTPSPIALN